MRISLNTRSQIVVTLAMLATLNPLAPTQTNPTAKSPAASVQPATPKTTPRAAQPATNFGPTASCQQFGLPPSQTTGSSHYITLTWKASATPSTPQNPVVYCLYRRPKTPNILDVTKCTDCELVTPTPINGLTCNDGFVENGQTYYYVAVARNGNGLSHVSNEATAVVNSGEGKFPPPTPYCGADPTLPSH